MILRIRRPDGTIADSENVPASARMHGYVAGASRYGIVATGGERVTPLPSSDDRSKAVEAQRAYRARLKAEA